MSRAAGIGGQACWMSISFLAAIAGSIPTSSAYEVTGTVKLSARQMVDRISGLGPGFTSLSEFDATYIVDQGRFETLRSTPPIQLDYKYFSRSLRRSSDPRCAGGIETSTEELVEFAGPAAINPGVFVHLKAATTQITDDFSPLPLRVTIQVNGGGSLNAHRNIKTTWPCNDIPVQSLDFSNWHASLPSATFEWPELLIPLFEETIKLKLRAPLDGIKFDSVSLRLDEGWSGFVEFDLAITKMPVVKATIETSKRDELVTFDAGGSDGQFTDAYWIIEFDQEACANPSVPSIGGSVTAAAIDPFLKNPLTQSVTAPPRIMVREAGKADRTKIETLLLCPLKSAQLLLREGFYIRSLTDALRPEIEPRDWRAVVNYKGRRWPQAVVQISGGTGLPFESSFRDRMLRMIEANAQTVPDICLLEGDGVRVDHFFEFFEFLPGQAIRLTACAQAVPVIEQQGDPDVIFFAKQRLTKLGKFLTFRFIDYAADSGISGGTGSLFEALTGTDPLRKPPGLFSGHYYVENVDNSLFDLVAIFAPWLPDPEHAASANDREYGKCVELHEFMHALFHRQEFAMAHGNMRPPPPSPLQSRMAFDPKALIETMFDNDLDHLITRIIVAVIRAVRLHDDTHHERMKKWRDWVTPADKYFDGSSLEDQLKHFESQDLAFSGADRPQRCGKKEFAPSPSPP